MHSLRYDIDRSLTDGEVFRVATDDGDCLRAAAATQAQNCYLLPDRSRGTLNCVSPRFQQNGGSLENRFPF